jgi:putative dimethyl sulfoxide reductase chaperone
MSDHDLDEGAARADLCRLLAACYYEPGPEFAEERVFDSMRTAAALVGPEVASLAQRLGQAFAAGDPEELLVDYTRLFLGPVDAAAKPYGSVWVTGEATLMQPSSMAVLAIYREGGFDLAEDFRELPDHVAAELEFLYLTLFRENAARRTDDLDAVAAALALRRRFLTEHLGAWVDPFTRAMENAAQTDYYRILAPLTRQFVTAELRHCS